MDEICIRVTSNLIQFIMGVQKAVVVVLVVAGGYLGFFDPEEGREIPSKGLEVRPFAAPTAPPPDDEVFDLVAHLSILFWSWACLRLARNISANSPFVVTIMDRQMPVYPEEKGMR